MGRAKVVLQADYPYNITDRCINKEWFHVPMDEVWNIFSEELERSHKNHGLVIHSFVLMSNHYHLIASTPEANISQSMHQFNYRSSRRLTRAGNRINQTFSGRHFKTILHHHNYYLNAYKYNYRNPVNAGICERAQDYPYSTLHSLLGLSRSIIPICEDTTYKFDPEGTLKWLNTAPDTEKLEAVRYALKRAYFCSKKNRVSNQPLLAENDIL